MSEIPFVKALGDEIERAAKRRRGRVRRRIAFGAVAFAIAATGVAAASGVFTSAPPDQLATTGISCYTKADLEHSDVSVLSTSTAPPIAACRRELHTDGPLVACAGPAVMVLRMSIKAPASFPADHRQFQPNGTCKLAVW